MCNREYFSGCGNCRGCQENRSSNCAGEAYGCGCNQTRNNMIYMGYGQLYYTPFCGGNENRSGCGNNGCGGEVYSNNSRSSCCCGARTFSNNSRCGCCGNSRSNGWNGSNWCGGCL